MYTEYEGVTCASRTITKKSVGVRRRPDVVLMLVQHLQRCPSIITALGRRLVIAGILPARSCTALESLMRLFTSRICHDICHDRCVVMNININFVCIIAVYGFITLSYISNSKNIYTLHASQSMLRWLYVPKVLYSEGSMFYVLRSRERKKNN